MTTQTDMEMSVLGAVLLDSSALDVAADMLAVKDFAQPEHQTVFKAMLSLSSRNNPVDMVTVSGLLIENGRGDLAVELLPRLLDVVPGATNIRYYCTQVKRHACRRRLKDVAETIARRLDGPDDVGDVLTMAEDEVLAIRQGSDRHGPELIRGCLQQAFDAMERARGAAGGVSGMSTGFLDLDRLLNGLNPPDLTIVAARPGMGKSALAANIIEAVSVAGGQGALMFSLEMGREQIAARMLSSQARVPATKIRTGNLAEADYMKLTHASDRLYRAPLWIDDAGGISINEIRARARRIKRESGDNLKLIVVDYLQLVSARAESRQQEISTISRGLKMMAKELHIPVIALSQLNRSLEARADKRPMMADLRESGAIEQDADNILFLYRPAVYDEKADPEKAECIIAKQRSGPTGIVPLAWKGEFTSYWPATN